MTNVGKKVSLFLVLNFCFAKSHLRVCDHIWEKSGRKVNHIVRKTWNLFLSKTTTLSRKLATKKLKSEISIFFVIQHESFFSKSLCNRFWRWCGKFVKMMDVCVVWKCSIFVQKPSKCLNSFLESIYFSVTFSISCFAKMLCSNSGLMNSLDHNIMAPQNFDPKFHIHEKVLNFCWLN